MTSQKLPVDLKYDFAFKYLLGIEDHQAFLVRFLNDILMPEPKILSVEIGNGENPPKYKGDKKTLLDIRAKTDSGTYLNVEIQVSDQQYIVKRMLYYWSKIYGSQLAAKEHYPLLNKTIGISIINFELNANQCTKYHTIYGLKELEKDFLLTDVMEFHIIELPKFVQSFIANECEISSAEELWWLLLTCMNKEEQNEVLYYKALEFISDGGDELMAKVLETWHKMTKEEAEKYWQEGIGQEMAHYDSKNDTNNEIVEKEQQLKTLLNIGKLTKEELKKVINLPDPIFNILYNRNKK